jgi:hypothetical protein
MTAARRQAQTRSTSAADARAYLASPESSSGPLRIRSGSGTEWQRPATPSVPASVQPTPSGQPERRWFGKGEHSQSPAHLERVGGADGRKSAAHLRRLITDN